jgi:hypothetical protein
MIYPPLMGRRGLEWAESPVWVVFEVALLGGLVLAMALAGLCALIALRAIRTCVASTKDSLLVVRKMKRPESLIIFYYNGI